VCIAPPNKKQRGVLQMRLKVEKPVKVTSIKLMQNYKINEKVINDARKLLKEAKKENKDLYMALVGTKENYEWLKSELEKIKTAYKTNVEKLNKKFEEGTMSTDEYDVRARECYAVYGSSRGDIADNIAVYDEYYKLYGDYNLIIFTMKDKKDEVHNENK
jgi:hypothetical protein